MLLIEQITKDPKQRRTLVLSNGTTINFLMTYVPLQLGWFITDLQYLDFKVRNIRIVNSLNILHQFKNKIPFGLACITRDGREPTQLEDFSSQNSNLYILENHEVLEYTEFLRSEV